MTTFKELINISLKINFLFFFLISSWYIYLYKGDYVQGHVVAIFGIKTRNGEKLFRVKNSNVGHEETIPVNQTTFQEEFQPQNQNFTMDTPYIASGYSIQLKKKTNP